MKLYDHQQKILSDNPAKTGLFLGTGSGKTRIALMLARRMGGKVLVIAPKIQVEDENWYRELTMIFADNLFGNQIDLTVISKEDFRRDWESLEAFDTVIVDEAHTCCGVTPNIRWIKKQPIPKTSQLFEALQSYIKKTNPKQLYLCTATPDRSPMTVWAAGTLLGKKWDWYRWRDTFYVRLPMPGREVFAVKKDNETKERLGAAVRSIGYTGRLSDYFDVPEQTYKTDYIELTQEQRKRIRELPIEFPDPLVLLGKTLSVENGILNGDEFNETEFFNNAKIEKILDYSIEFPRMIVFAKYINQIKQISSVISGRGKKVFILTGETKDRGELLKEVNNTEEYVFVVQCQISSGWQIGKTKDHPEYFDCNVMIFASMDYSVVNRIQAEGRILRSDNLKKNLFITLVVRKGIDQAVYESIKNKKDFNERIFLQI